MAGLIGLGEIVVTRDDAGVAEALVAQLRGRRFSARVADTVDASAHAVIFLGGLSAPADDDAAIEINRAAFRAAKAFAPRADHGGVFVTVQDTGGDLGMSGCLDERAWLGGLAGLAKTASLEWPRVSVKAIDLQRGGRTPNALATAICTELFGGGVDLEVGLRADGRRTVFKSVRQEPHATREPRIEETVNSASVLVCSGGARGVTAATLIALAKEHKPRIALLGRTALADEPAVCVGVADDAGLKRALLMTAKAEGRAVKPAELGAQVRGILAVREIRGTLAALEAAGSQARYLSVDVSNADDVRVALEQVRQSWGPITGIIHGAGVVADKLIADKTAEQFERVLKTKVGGIRVLLEATSADPLSLLVMFSSVAARTGNVGQCDYAMANEMLNKVAARYARQHEQCVVKSLNWGPWEAGMVTPELKRYFTEHGVALIPLEVGARMMLDELADDSHIEVVLGGAPRRASIAGEEGVETHFAVHVDVDSHPYLVDHSIEQVPVLPVVLVLEWFARAATALCPGLAVAACRDVRVFRGVPLKHFHDGGEWLSLRCNKLDERAVEVTLCNPSDPRIRHYAAVVDLAEPESLSSLSQGAERPLGSSPLELEPLQVPIYGDALFHGPQFQVIRNVQGVGVAGIAGELVGTEAQQWIGGPWRTDPALLDGGLQLAVLWAQQKLGGRGLPTGLSAYRSFSAGRAEGPLRCTVSARADGHSKAVSDITFIDQQGRIVSRLEGVETHQRP